MLDRLKSLHPGIASIKRIAGTLGILVCLGGFHPGLAAKPKSVETSLPPPVAEASRLLDKGFNEECERVLSEFLRSDKTCPDAFLLHAEVLYRLQRYHYGADEVRIALAARPEDPNAHLLSGKIWQSMRRPRQAAEEYRRYLELAPPADVRKAQYKTLLTVLEEQAKEQVDQSSEQRARAGDYLNVITARGGVMRWKNAADIKVHIADGTGVEDYRPEFEESLRQAFDDWAESTKGTIKFVFVSDPKDAQMSVVWTSDLHSPALKAEAGLAQSKYGPDGIEESKISLLTRDPFKEAPIGRNYLYNVCLHEIGHALGLQEHSPHQDDIMFPSLYTQQGLSARDINTVLALYSDKAEQAAAQQPYVDEWGRPLTPAAKAERLTREGTNAAMSGEYQKAIGKLEEALKLNPKNTVASQNYATAANNLAIARGTTRQQAIILLRKALQWDPASEVCKQNLQIFLNEKD